MADLTTELCGIRLRNPVIAASCEVTMTEEGIRACLDAGAGAVVAKSVNELPAAARQLAAADYTLLDDELRPVPWGAATGAEILLNRSGLVDTGIDEWVAMLERTQRHAVAADAAVIGSITVASPEGAATLAARLAEVVPAVELNIGAPHGRESSAVEQVTETEGVARYVRAVRAAVSCPLIVKLPGQAGDIVSLARAAVANGADAVTMIGRSNGFVPSLDTWEPELGSAGAVGGRWMLPISLYSVSSCFRALPAGTPLIGTNGARDGLDVARFVLSGARAVELASLLMMRGPGALTEVVSDLDSYLDQHGVGQVGEVVGVSASRSKDYGEFEPFNPPRRPWLDR